MSEWSRPRAFGIIASLILLWFWRPLSGFGVLLPNDLLNDAAPWASERIPSKPWNPWLGDTLAVHSQFASISDRLWSGTLSWWDRSLIGGIPTLKAGFSPLLIPYLVVPATYAPGLVAAMRTGAAAGFLYGYLRRGMKVDRVAAVVGAIAYGFCGYMIGWGSWPHSNVAAFAPAVLWSVESLVRDRRPRTVVFLALSVAALVLSNFPLAAFYVMLSVGFYGAARLLTRRRGEGDRRSWSSILRTSGWAIAGVVLGLCLTAIYLSEFANYYGFSDTSARQAISADSSIGSRFLLTLVAPWAFGSPHRFPEFWATDTSTINWVEAQGFVGGSVLLLALMALAVRTRTGERGERAVAVRILWVIAIFGVWLSYLGGPLTEGLQSLPLIGDNAVGRARVVFHLAFAALAGLGVQAVLDHRRHPEEVDFRRWFRMVGPLVALAFVGFSPRLLEWGREARAKGVLDEAIVQSIPFAVIGVLSALLLVVMVRQRRQRQFLGLALVVLVSAELMWFGASVATVVPRTIGSYDTASHELIRELLDEGERLGGDARTYFANTNQLTGYSDVRGHLLYSSGWRQALETVEPGLQGSVSNPWFTAAADIENPLLDAMAVGLWAEDPRLPVRGVRQWPEAGDSFRQNASWSFDLEIPPGGLRAVTLMVGPGVAEGHVIARVRRGNNMVEGARSLSRIGENSYFDVPLAGEHLPEGSATVELIIEGTLNLAVGDGQPMAGTVSGGDSLVMVSAGPAVLYERPSAAAVWFIPEVTPEQVRLEVDGPTHPEAVMPGQISVQGGTVNVGISVDQPGTLLVSQSPFPGWRATVDGQRVSVVGADDLITGIALEPGDHVVSLVYRPEHFMLLASLSVGAVGVLLWLLWWDRSARMATGENERDRRQ